MASYSRQCAAQVAKQPHEILEPIIRVEAARVGKHPHRGVADPDGLRTDSCATIAEGCPVGADAENDDQARPDTAQLRCKLSSTANHLPGTERTGCSGGAVNKIGDADTVGEQLALFVRGKQSRSETGAVQRRPKAVAGAGEVVPDCCRAEAGVDADENKIQSPVDER